MGRTGFLLAASAAAVLIAAGSAQASTVDITSSNMQGWSSPPSENSGGGAVAIVGTPSYGGNGSLQMTGDRGRFVLGGLIGLYGDPSTYANNLGPLSDFTDLSFSYEIDPASTSLLDPKYSPALGLVIWVGGTREDLIFEQAYQAGGYGSEGPIGTWNTTSSTSLFYLQQEGNVNDDRTITQWLSDSSLNGAVVGGIYAGVGGGPGSEYKAYVGDIVANGTTYDFISSVPEPASWAMLILGFFGLGGVLRASKPHKGLVAEA
ncbi:MAG: hypothetical protein ACRED9_13710 [Caulobacteraceae bacterium]